MIPSKGDLAPSEVAIRVTDDALDERGHVQLTAYWLSHLQPDGVGSWTAHTHLEDFVNREHLAGQRVTALDERTHKMLDGLGIVVPVKGGLT